MNLNTNTKGFSYAAQLGMLLGLVGAGLVLASVTGAFILSTCTGVPLQQVSSLEVSDPRNLSAFRVVQVVTTLIGFLLPAWAFATLAYKKASVFMGTSTLYTTRQFFLALTVLLTSILALSALTYINEQIPLPASWQIEIKALDAAYNKQIEAFTKMNGVGDLMISLLTMAILPAVVEEILFRGCLQNIMVGLTKRAWLGIFITSILFSLMHLSWTGFLARLFLGLVLGLLYYYSKSIWLSITAHALFNGFQIIAVYMYPSFVHGDKFVSISWINWLALALAIFLLYVIYKEKNTKAYSSNPKDSSDF